MWPGLRPGRKPARSCLVFQFSSKLKSLDGGFQSPELWLPNIGVVPLAAAAGENRLPGAGFAFASAAGATTEGVAFWDVGFSRADL